VSWGAINAPPPRPQGMQPQAKSPGVGRKLMSALEPVPRLRAVKWQPRGLHFEQAPQDCAKHAPEPSSAARIHLS